jgi:hypothetical protein
MWVRITRRLAECVNGVDLSGRVVGDLLDLAQRDAEMLVAEGWATAIVIERRSGQDRRDARHENATAPADTINTCHTRRRLLPRTDS